MKKYTLICFGIALMLLAVPAIAASTTKKPVNQTAPVVTGTTTQGQTLSTNDGTWTNSPTSFVYRWQRCTNTGACSNITGATHNSYMLTSSDVGLSMRSVVTAINSFGSAPSASSFTSTVAAILSPPSDPPPPPSNVKTAISLTFDDGNVEHYAVAKSILQAHNMAGTFYINSALIGDQGKMTWAQVADLASTGNEIAGHTLHHVDLASLSMADATTEICQDRQNITSHGYAANDFAYPFGSANNTVENIVKNCGYDSARTIANLQNQSSCQNCQAANDIPPADPYNVFTNSSIKASTPLSTLEWDVTNAESQGGGWVPMVFHHICVQGQNVPGTNELCDPTYSIDPATLSAFLDWLQPRTASSTAVETVHQVMASPAPAPGPNLVQNSSLETRTSGSTPDNYQLLSNSGTTYSWVTTPVHSGSHAEQMNTSVFNAAGPQVFTTQAADTAGAPHVTAGHVYKASVWYQSQAAQVFLNVYYHDGTGWHFWRSSAPFGASSDWAQARFTTPAVPSGADALSIGLQPKSAGVTTVDDFYLYDTTI